VQDGASQRKAKGAKKPKREARENAPIYFSMRRRLDAPENAFLDQPFMEFYAEGIVDLQDGDCDAADGGVATEKWAISFFLRKWRDSWV
jgi:hypothetical protein